MQNAQDIYLQTIERLLEENEVEKALDALLELDKQTQADIRSDIILQSGNFREASKSLQRGLISFEEYSRYASRTRYALLELMKEVPRRIELNARLRGLSAYQFKVPDDARLEKIIGPQNNLLKINWLEKALQASKAVCRVVCADGNLGTGFLTREGYIFTNHHVLGSPEIAATARVEFNYELDANGQVKSRTSYELDPTGFITSPPDELDFARVLVKDRSDAPLSQWGFVEFDPEAIPVVGDAVTIVQHPKGEDKQIALSANDVVSVWEQRLFYTTDTEPGSSGSPVFNRDWKVVAIHHAGKTDAEGGIQINAQGERRGANRGILFRNIFAFIRGDKPAAMGSSGGGRESTAESTASPVATPSVPTPAVSSTPSAPPIQPPAAQAAPKFVVVYALNEDDAHCKALNKHLNVLKITKKIRVYNISDATGGEDLLARAEKELADADYILALVTVNLFSSAEWFGLVYTAMETGRRVIPIRIEPADYEGTGLEKLKSLPSMGRSVRDFPNTDAAYADIVMEIKKLL